jgi:hypothetical protein
MSQQLISRSPDLKQLGDEGYDIEVRSAHLLIKTVPYVNSNKEIKYGTLVSELTLAGDMTTTPNTHVAYFIGEYPCNKDGTEITQIRHQSGNQELDKGLVVHHSFSSKPNSGYINFYDKMTTYVAIISSPAQSIDPSVTARTFQVTEPAQGESVFNYLDTASTRAGISVPTRKLELERIAIVGVGGTGSYVLDLVAKTPVKQIDIFDGDKFGNHNAFRSPGAPSIDELRQMPQKVIYFQERYSKLHRNIVAHDCFIDTSNVDQLKGMDFVFLSLDRGGDKRLIVDKLEEWGIPFIDVGMGVQLVDESLLGILRITTSTVEQREHVKAKNRIPFSDGDGNNDYARNIQIADLNALNASLAVIKWKKLFGFYLDLEKEHYSAYTIDGNTLTNEDQP